MTRRAATDRAARWVLAWCDRYTRGLPPAVAAERRDELTADVYDQRLDAALAGLPDAAVARSLLFRTLRGVPADLSWRTHQLRAHRSAAAKEKAMNVGGVRDGWTVTAYLLGAVLFVWSGFLAVGMLGTISAADNSWDVFARWGIGIGALVALGLSGWGLWALTRHPTGAGAALSVTAVLTTVWMFWAGAVVIIGLAIAAFFVTFAIRSRRARPVAVAA